MVGIERFIEARPAGAGFEFGAGSEQRQAAQPAAISTRLLVVEEASAKRRLGPMVEHDPPLLGCESLG